MRKRGQNVGHLANAEAAVLGHDYVGTEHLLLAVCGQAGTVAAWALASKGIDAARLRSAIAQIVRTKPCKPSGPRPWTPRAKKAVEVAIEEAWSLGHNYLGPEHLLLGLLQVGEGVAVQAVRELWADPTAIRQAVLEGLEQA